ncbi:Uncharacterised protein [uncultured archaeon]|nr:Uncharacterised protein [uncultured archaeon]
MPNKNLISENEVPENWTPAASVSQAQSPSAPPLPNAMPSLFSGSMPPALQHDKTFVGTEVGTPAIPKFSLMPFGLQGNPVTNAAVQSTVNTGATTIVKQIIGGGGGGGGTSSGLTSVGISAPSEVIVTNSPLTSNGVIGLDWSSEPTNTVFAAPGPGLTGLQAVGENVQLNTTNLTVTATPKTASTFGLYSSISGTNSLGAPAGWTTIITSNGQNIFWRAISGTAPVTASQTIAAASNYAACLAIFNGPQPSLVQQANSSSALHTFTLAFPAGNIAGNTLVVILQETSSGNPLESLSCSDSNGNSYQILSSGSAPYTASPVATGAEQTIFIAPNCKGGANTVTANFSGTAVPAFSRNLVILEFGSFPSGSNKPLFRNLDSAMIPPIQLGQTGNGGVGGTLRVDSGGTGANLSSTGGGGLFLHQASTGSAITVVQPDYSDLAGVGLASQYNSVPLVSNGLTTIPGTYNFGNATANIAASTIFTPTVAGIYRINFTVTVGVAATTSSTLPNIQIQWTDGNNSAAQTASFVSATPSANTLQTMVTGSLIIYAKASVAVQLQTGNLTAYASTGATAMTYNVHVRAEML